MFKELRKSEFVRQVLTLFTGSAIAQSLPFFAEPAITRLYTPAELAIIGLYTSVAMMFAIVATGRYELAIMLPRSKRKSINLVALSFFITIGVTIISFFSVFLLNDWICEIQKSDVLGQFLWYVPISVFAIGVFSTLNQWTNRQGHHKWMAASRITQSGTNSSLALIFGFLKMGNLGLIIAYISGQVLSVFPVLIKFLKKDKSLLKEVTKKEIKEVAIEYKKFPTINSLHAFADMFFLSALMFLLLYYFGEDATGYYSRTYKILLVPAIFIGSAISQIFFRKISTMKTNNEPMIMFLRRMAGILFLIGLPIFVLLMVLGPQIFEFVLGDGYFIAGQYAAILAPWIWMKFIVSPFTLVPVVFNKLSLSFLFGSICNIGLVLTIIIGGSQGWSIYNTFYLLSAVQLFVLPIYLYWTFSLAKNYNKV